MDSHEVTTIEQKIKRKRRTYQAGYEKGFEEGYKEAESYHLLIQNNNDYYDDCF